jgi:hypothetical protein
MARKIADLEKLVHLLREEGRERDRELARIGAILSAGTRGGQGWPEREVEGP